MKVYFPVERGADRWYFEYQASEDPMPDLLSVGLNAIPSPAQTEPLYVILGQTLLETVKAEYYGGAFLVVHESLYPKEELETKQKELSAKGWSRAERPPQIVEGEAESCKKKRDSGG